MSYDINFRFRDIRSPADKGEFHRYFLGRSHFQAKNTQAWYSNDATGVYFSFDIDDVDSEHLDESSLPGLNAAPVSFNMNLYRPHYFALEAEPEIRSFVRQFDLLVSDPQINGMGSGEYTTEGFLNAWNTSNEFAYRAMVNRADIPPVRNLPTDLLERIWRWNFAKDTWPDTQAEDIFVPRISLFEVNGILKTGVVWVDAIPILIPQVDVVLAPRKELAPRRLFRETDDIAFFLMEEFQSILSRYPSVEGPFPARHLMYSRPPMELENLISSKPSLNEQIHVIGMDQVLNSELVERATRRSV